MAISKPRHRGRSSRRGRRSSNRSSRRRDHHQRTAAEQLDYEMELLRAQREGREEEFKEEERKKMRVRAAARLDAEMDEYFKARPTKDDAEDVKGDASNVDSSNVTVGANGADNNDKATGNDHVNGDGDKLSGDVTAKPGVVEDEENSKSDVIKN